MFAITIIDILFWLFLLFPFLIFIMGIYIGMKIKDREYKKLLEEPQKIINLR